MGWNEDAGTTADADAAPTVAIADENATAPATPARPLVYDERRGHSCTRSVLRSHQPMFVLRSFYAALCFPAVLILHILTFLATHWSVNFDALVNYSRKSVRCVLARLEMRCQLIAASVCAAGVCAAIGHVCAVSAALALLLPCARCGCSLHSTRPVVFFAAWCQCRTRDRAPSARSCMCVAAERGHLPLPTSVLERLQFGACWIRQLVASARSSARPCQCDCLAVCAGCRRCRALLFPKEQVCLARWLGGSPLRLLLTLRSPLAHPPVSLIHLCAFRGVAAALFVRCAGRAARVVPAARVPGLAHRRTVPRR